MSMARWLTGRAARVRVADSRAAPPHAEQLARRAHRLELPHGAFRPESFADAELIAISPGVTR